MRVAHTVKVEADTVYVIPPGKMLQSMDGHIVLGDLPPSPRKHVVVDMFFRTLADTHGANALAIVLSGAGGDGSLGVAYDGKSALSILPSLLPAVIFLDLGMPEMDGFEVACHVKAQPWADQVRLIAVTGWGQPEDMERTRLAGFARHLVKPATEEELFQALREVQANWLNHAHKTEGRPEV